MATTSQKLQIEMSLRDFATGALKRFRTEMTRTDAAGKKAFGSVNEQARKTNAVMGALAGRFGSVAVAAVAVGIAIRGISTTLRRGVTSALAFGTAMNEVRSIAEISADGFQRMTENVERLAVAFGQSEIDVAGGQYEILSADIKDSVQSMILLEGASKLAVATFTQTRQTVDLLTSVFKAYGLTITEDAVAAMNALIFAAVDLGKVTLPQLASSMGRVLPIASQLGVPIKELFAAVATLSLAGTSADEAVTQLRQTMLTYLAPSKDAADFSKQIGLEFSATSLRAKGLIGSFRDLRSVLQGNSESLEKLFPNIRALGGVIALTGNQFESFERILRNVEDGAGRFDTALDVGLSDTQKRLGTTTKGLSLGMQDLARVFLDALVPGADQAVAASDSLRASMRTMKPAVEALVLVIKSLGLVVSVLAVNAGALRFAWEDLKNVFTDNDNAVKEARDDLSILTETMVNLTLGSNDWTRTEEINARRRVSALRAETAERAKNSEQAKKDARDFLGVGDQVESLSDQLIAAFKQVQAIGLEGITDETRKGLEDQFTAIELRAQEFSAELTDEMTELVAKINNLPFSKFVDRFDDEGRVKTLSDDLGLTVDQVGFLQARLQRVFEIARSLQEQLSGAPLLVLTPTEEEIKADLAALQAAVVKQQALERILDLEREEGFNRARGRLVQKATLEDARFQALLIRGVITENQAKRFHVARVKDLRREIALLVEARDKARQKADPIGPGNFAKIAAATALVFARAQAEIATQVVRANEVLEHQAEILKIEADNQAALLGPLEQTFRAQETALLEREAIQVRVIDAAREAGVLTELNAQREILFIKATTAALEGQLEVRKQAAIQAQLERERFERIRADIEGDDFGEGFKAQMELIGEGFKAGALGADVARASFSALDSNLNSFIDSAFEGKAKFAEFAQSMIRDIGKIIVKFLLLRAIAAAFGFGGGGGAGAAASGPPPVSLGFAKGGIMPGKITGHKSIARSTVNAMQGGGTLPVRQYAHGGVASSPQLAIFGEGRGAEAFVPLGPDRKIPVKFPDQPGNQQRGSPTLNLTVQSLDPSTAADVILANIPLIAEQLAGVLQTGANRSLTVAVRTA